MTQEELQRKSAEAEYVLGSSVFKEAFDEVREGLINSIEYGPLDDEKIRDKLMLSLQILVNIKDKITSHIEAYQMSLSGNEEL